MTGRSVAVLLWCAAISWGPAVGAQSRQRPPRESPPSVSAVDQAVVKRGEAVFSRHCPICHLGRPAASRPFVGRNLRGILKNAKPAQDAAVRDAIQKGNDRMPGFQYTLTPMEIDDLVSYLKTYN